MRGLTKDSTEAGRITDRPVETSRKYLIAVSLQAEKWKQLVCRAAASDTVLSGGHCCCYTYIKLGLNSAVAVLTVEIINHLKFLIIFETSDWQCNKTCTNAAEFTVQKIGFFTDKQSESSLKLWLDPKTLHTHFHIIFTHHSWPVSKIRFCWWSLFPS